MRYDTVCKICKTQAEVAKPMAAPLPPCHACGGELRRVFAVTPVIYNAPGFFTTDNSFAKQVGPEHAHRFEKVKAAALERRARGTQTAYERRLENV